MDIAHPLDPAADVPSTSQHHPLDASESEDPNSGKQHSRAQDDKDMVTVEFYAVLRNSGSFHPSEESMHICGKDGTIAEMSPISGAPSGTFFKASILVDISDKLTYKYCRFKNGKEKPEQITVDGKDTFYRTLNLKELLQPGCKVIEQYDDICMKSEKLHHMGRKKTEITGLRPKFLQTVLHFALRCNDNELNHLENKFNYILKSIQSRQLLDCESNETREQPVEYYHHFAQPLKDVIESFSVNNPISYLLATMFFANYTHTDLDQNSTEKLSEFAKTQAKKEIPIPNLTDSMRREICIKVLDLFTTSCARHLSGVIWLLGLFYKVLSPAMTLDKDIKPTTLNWIQTNIHFQTELLEMVKHHEQQLQQHPSFAQYVLCDMFSVEIGHHNVLKYLGYKPLKLLSELQRWMLEYPHIVTSEELTVIIETVADITKKWFQSRQPDDISHEDLSACVSLALKIIKEMQMDKQDRQCPKNIISSLKLLSSFSKVLKLLQENKEMNLIMETYSDVEKHLKSCIKATSEKNNGDKLQFFLTVFQIELPSLWQEKWKETLKELFTECVQKMVPEKQMEYYSNYTETNSTVEECLMNCALQTVKNKFWHLRIIRKSKKYPKLISYLICDIWKDLKDEAKDWKYLLTNPHCSGLFRELVECQHLYLGGTFQKEKLCYKDELTEQAKGLLTNIQCLLSKLHQNLYGLPARLMLEFLENKELANTIQLYLNTEDKSVLSTALKAVENDIKEFKHKQEQSEALLELIQDKSAVSTLQIRENISIVLSDENRSLSELFQLWEGIDILSFENIKIAAKSRFFTNHWKSASEKDEQSHNAATISLCDLHERVFKPALADFNESFVMIRDLSMHVDEFETILADCHENQIEEELKVMQQYMSDNTETKWIKDACDCIRRYRELCHLEKQTQGIYSLKKELCLEGDFPVLLGIQQKDILKTKCLRDFTKEMEQIAEKLSHIDDHVLCLIEEFTDCVNKGFIKWIKSIITGQRELNVFVELASAFAGENQMDLDKVRYFSDAVFACAPLIFELDVGAGFDRLMDEIRKLKEPARNDPDLPEKLKDSCACKAWLETAYTAHGSVAKSSLLQADEINKHGVYSITQPSSQSLMTVEDCISLKVQKTSFTLSQLQELQNKLMLIPAVDRKGSNNTVSQFVEVFEQILQAAQLLIKLREAGHILFTDWSLTGFCEDNSRKRKRAVSVHVDFGIAGLKITGNQRLLVELQGICKSMQDCLEKWVNYTTQHRDEYYYLNYFTAKQLSRLCCCMADMKTSGRVPSSILNMLSFIKDNVTMTDLMNAFTAALQSPVQHTNNMDLKSCEVRDYLVRFPELIEYVVDAGYSEASAKAAVMCCKNPGDGTKNTCVDEDAVMDCVYENSNDNEWVDEWSLKYDEERESVLQSQMKFTGGHVPEEMKPAFSMSEEEIKKMFEKLTSCKEKITIIWEAYCGKLSGLVSDKYVGLDLVGETLKELAQNEVPVQRKLSCFLEKGKPNLVSCNIIEMLPQCLSLYLNNEQPLPTYDEILICTPETTSEEVELIIRRAVQSGSRHEKIYSLLNAENLRPEVTRVLESNFCHLSQSQKVTEAKEYNFVIFCNSKAHHSYVLTAFDEYRKTLQAKEYKEVHELLKMKHKLSSATAFPTAIIQEEFRQSIKMISSARAGMGKTLFVKNLIRRSKEKLSSQGFTHKTISITDKEIKPGFIYDKLKEYEDKPNDNIPRIFHFDVPPVVCKGLYTFLVQLFVLRCFQSLDGFIWKCKDTHVYLVEYTERKHRQCDRASSEISNDLEDSLLEMFTTVKCFSPEDALTHLKCGNTDNSDKPYEFQLMDDSKFRSEEFQRTYQYLKHFQENNLEELKFDRQKCIGSPVEWLECILHYCKISSPSWAELCNFTQFLNVQLKRCDESVFCSAAVSRDLTGFRNFVVKFMITMSRDFIMPSLDMSDESCGPKDKKNERKNGEERKEHANRVLSEFQIRKHWEQEAHPYVMFNSDGMSMTFLGFHIKYQNAIDVRTCKIIERNVMTSLLFQQLKAQGVPMNVDFKTLNRSKQLEILCQVLGVEKKEDPDSTYQLTLDNVLKILAIHMRFQCNIPVVIMGETGCGKTRLVKFMCDLLKKCDDKTNLIVVSVHGGTTADMIYEKVRQAIAISKTNSGYGMYTVLFFDEANTTEALYAIKEVMCDRAVNGEQIDAPDLKFVAACNPYKMHTKSAIEQLEKAGLGYRVCAEDASEKLGQIPMRQLVYRVQPLPPSLSSLVWDFGKLNEYAQNLYISKMVETFFKEKELNEQHKSVFTNVICISQIYVAAESNECRMVSLRDIERCMKTVMWFYHQRETLFPLVDQKKKTDGSVQRRNIDDLIRSLILAIGVCYSASLEHRTEYIEKVARALTLSAHEVLEEIDLCQEVFVDNVDIPAATARNDALKENVFMMIVCMNLRLPLFLVGKPGSSKSLSKTVAADALQGKSSRSELFKSYKQAQLLSFQCSAHSTPDGIISTFRQCAQLQVKKNLDEYVSVVVLDEIGLAEDSPKMPLKTLHPLLECGCIDDEKPEEFKKVGFIGLSNWSLDPAKMNRGILLLRASPGEQELEKTAKNICSAQEYARPLGKQIEESIQKLTRVYSGILHKQKQATRQTRQPCNEFYGLRDYYNLIKVIVTYAQSSEPSTDNLARAVQRNFGVLDSVNSLEIFSEEFKVEVKPAKTIDLVRENLETKKTTGLESRYLLLLSSNNAALSILLRLGIITNDNTEVIFGSGFPLDQEYSQVCRTVNRVKTCMETGRSVVLLNIQSLYESLYDALNQCYVKLGGSVYVDLGLGAHRVKCKVNEDFRLIVIEEKNIVYGQFPAPLLSRLEKHCLEFNTILPEHAKQLQTELEKQIEEIFLGNTQNKCDALIGFTQDSCASVLLQCCPNILLDNWDANLNDVILKQCTEKLVQCATLDSVIRVEKNTEEVQKIYFKEQIHTNLMDVIKKYRRDNDKRMCLEVSTYSLLLNQRNLKFINEELKISKEQSHLLQIREFQTEQAFCEAVRKFFRPNSEDRVLILLQFYFENSNLSQRLLSCARYCISKLLKEAEKSVMVDVILLIRLPRVLGGCGYTSISGDTWDCVHLDELMPTKGLPADMQTLCRMPLSEVFEQSLTFDDDDICKPAPEKSQEMISTCTDKLVDTWLLMKKSMQKAIIQLNDKANNSPRAQKRVEILHDLLHAKLDVSRSFIEVLERRVVKILTARENEKTRSWVITQAQSNNFVVEGTSFRHVLWIQMEDAVASAMAQVFAVVDGDNNLNHVTTGQPPQKTKLWIKIFQDQDLLTIPVLPKLSYSVLSTSNTKETAVSCRFPFSWVVKARFDQIWRQVHNLPGVSSMPKLEQIQKCEELIKFPWLYGLKGTHPLFRMYAEDLVRMSMPEYPTEVNQAFSVSLVELSKNVYKDLKQADPNDVSLLWLHVTYEGMHENHQIFHKLLQQCGDMISTTDVKEATEAMHLLLKKLQPSNELLNSYTSCQAWLNKVKSVSTSVELIVSEDSLFQQHGPRGEELIQSIKRLWNSTQVVYLLMDNLLQDEPQMEEKLLGIITKNFIHFSKRILKKDMDLEQTFMEVTRVLKQCNTNACKTYLTTDCASCGNEFKDPVKLPCGHIFCKSCIEDIMTKACFTCNKPIASQYEKCEPVKREAMLQMKKFQSHCNTFFVEFILKCCVKENTEITKGVVNLLLDFVKGNPQRKGKPTRKTTELSPFHEFMDPSPAVQSLVLKILLTSRMDQVGPHLQRYIEAAVKSNQKNTDEFYFMVVRCTEDQIQTSARKALIPKATECLNMDFSSFARSESDVTFDVLYNIAKIRFAVSVAANVIGVLVQTQDNQIVEDETNDLFQKLQQVVTKNPWAQIFLLRNLCNKFDFKSIESVQCTEKLSWIVPEGVQTTKVGTDCTDKFLVYGTKYTDLTDTTNLKEMAAEDSSLVFSVCAALAAVREILNGSKSDKENNSLIKQVEMVSKNNEKWQNLFAICKTVMQDGLSKISKKLCLSHTSGLNQVILHTVIVVTQSTAPEMKLLKTFCSQPGKLKKTFIPTMPDPQQEMEGLKTPSSMETFWECQCGLPVLIEDCGRPWVIGLCPQCKRMIGGELHKPVYGFTEIQMSADNQMGYILGDASNRIYPGCERDLSEASLCLVRALIHSCLLWGAIDNQQTTKNLIAVSTSDVGTFLLDHLQKDIELLGKALGKNTENAEIAVHMFLRHIIESASADCNTDFCATETREKRNQWENIMQSKTKTFFKDFEKNLSEVHKNILKWSEENPLVNILYKDVPKMEGLSTVGPFNCPIMWRYEQKMSVQLLTHLIEQDCSSNKYPVLLDLVRKHGHIKNIRHLPQILSCQQKLMHHFHFVDSSEWKDLSFEEFLTKAPQGEVTLFEETANVLMNIWANLKDSSVEVVVPAHLKEKEKSTLMISDLLPLENPQTVIVIVTRYLAKMQNDCINSAKIQQSRMIESENLKPSHMITCDLEEDFLPIAISNIAYVVNEDGTETIDYNFKTLEKQLINRFISEKPTINLSTLPVMECNPVKTLQSFFSNIKDNLVPLSVLDKNYIMNEMKFIDEISAALSTLKIAIGFLQLSSSISSPNMLLVNYMKNELRMEDRSKHLQLPVLRTCQIKHIQSLWEVLFTRRSTLLTEMNQEPFYMINAAFHVSFSPDEEHNVNNALAIIRNLDLFIIELHDVIMNIDNKSIKPAWEIKITFETFLLYEKQLDEDLVHSLLEHLREDLTMEYVVSLWKLAVKRRVQNI